MAASRILLVRADDGLVVKRAGEREDGSRLLVCDNHASELEPYPQDADIFGQIGWAGRVTVKPADD